MTFSAEPATSTQVLAGLREESRAMTQAEVRRIQLILEWCQIHTTDDEDTASFGEHGIPIAGDGAPWVQEFAVMEVAAALGMSTDSGKRYVGRIQEVRYRLPRIWERVAAGELAFWKAGMIAEKTMVLCEDGAGFVDDLLWHVAHKVTTGQLLKVVDEAITRFDPELAEEQRLAAADGRKFDVHTRQVSIHGTVDVTGVLDLADALDLDDAVSAGAQQLKAAGCEETLDVRRSLAAGDLARGALGLDFPDSEPVVEARGEGPSVVEVRGEGPSVVEVRAKRASKPRPLVLHVHLSEAALWGHDDGVLARLPEGHVPVLTEAVRAWASNPAATIIVKPIKDLGEHVHVDRYEIPDRARAQAAEINQTCVFPWCTRPAEKADCDHTKKHQAGGPTCSCNLAPLCRGHHRAKTHSGWTYDAIDADAYVWRSPNGLWFRRDHHGTTPITPPT